MPVGQYSSACLLQGSQSGTVAGFGTLPVNFSGETIDNTPSMFTIGGWMRLLSSPLGGVRTIFSAQSQTAGQGQFSLTINADGVLIAAFAVGTSPSVTADVAITDTAWHYVAASFQGSPPVPNQGGDGTLQIYVDGLPVAVGPVNSAAMGTAGACDLGVNAPELDFASWSVWATAVSTDVMDVPTWGVPPAGSEAARRLAAAFDFANGGAVDASGNNQPVNVAQQYWHTPCLQLSPGGRATPESADELNPGGPAPFSVLAWVLAPNEYTGSYPVVTNGDGTTSFAAAIITDGAGNQTLEVTRTGATIPSTPLTAPGAWTHVAVTYDQTSFAVYVNGALQSSTAAASGGLAAITPDVSFGGPGGQRPMGLQGLSVWSTALDAADIDGYMDGADPTGVTGCEVYYALMTDLGNTTRETVLTATNAQIGEMLGTFTAPRAEAAPAAPQPVAATPPGELPLLGVAGYKALAASQAIDVSSPLDAATASGDLAEVLAWYEGFLDGVPSGTAALLREEFGRNLRIGLALGEKGIRTGGFDVAAEDGQTVFYFHTADGPQEVGRLDLELDPYVVWCAQIFADVLGIVAAMFGIVTTAAKVTKAVGLFDDLFPAIGTAARNAEGQTTAAKACSAIFGILKVLWEWKALFSLIKQMITASWWSLVFTVLGLVAQIAALVTSGGALIAWKVAQMAIAIGNLVNDLLHVPQEVAAE